MNRGARLRAAVLLAAVAVVGAAGLRWSLARGIGLNPDSASYIDGAVHLAQGEGYRSSLYRYLRPGPADEYVRQAVAPGGVRPQRCLYFPLFYPAVLAVPIRAGVRPESAALWLSVLLFGLNAFLVGRIVYDATRGSTAFAVGAAVFTLGSESMLFTHSTALSEPLFIFLCLSGLRLLGSYLDSGRPARLVAAGLVAGFAFLTRYPGAALVGTGMFGLATIADKPVRRRAVTGLGYAALGCLPIAAFMFHGYLATGHGPVNPPALRPASAGDLYEALKGLSAWILPGSHRVELFPGQAFLLAALAAAALLGFPAACFFSANRRARGPRPGAADAGSRAPVLYAAFIPAYLAAFLVADAVLKGSLLPDIRLLAPAFPPVVIVVAWWIRDRLESAKKPKIKRAVAAALAAYGLVYAGSGAYWMKVCHRLGRGYNNSEFQAADIAPAMAFVRTMGAVPVFTNDCGALYFQAGRFAYQFPSQVGTKDPAVIAAALGPHPAVFVYYWTRAHLGSAGEGADRNGFESGLVGSLGLQVLARSKTITVLWRPGRASS